ncbi:MAG TPA: type I polyketide synthase, partial [Pseudonocardiaceae bacterium]
MTTGSDLEAQPGRDNVGSDMIAIVGMACRYPDADDPTQLWQMVLDQRQAFRELPPERLDLPDYFDPDRAAPDKTYGSMAALIEGWTFDRAAFRIPGASYRATDPAHWLALETASRTLDDAGYPGGQGLNRDRVAVVIGNSLTGDVTRAATLRLRWPYVRRTLAAAATDAGLSEQQRATLIARAQARYLEAFPPVGDETLAGSLSNTIAGRVCNHFDFRGGGYTVDGACSSALLAVITACRSLRDGSADLVLAGGVDLSIDPFELVGFAKTGALAATRMRVYDERSSGFIPGEGCGVIALMRAKDAHAAGARVYAEITGWGLSSDGNGGITRPDRQGQLLALRRAYALAGVDPAAVGLLEGHGTGTQVGDETELSALAELRREASQPAAIGSIKANIGHTKAASGLAGLIKAALSVASGVLPPTTGCERPHPVLRSPGSPLRVLSRPEPWPAGPRVAGVSSFGFGGINAHVTLAQPPATVARVVAAQRCEHHRPTPRTDVIALAGDDLDELRAVLNRLAEVGHRLSEAELHDVACQFARRKPDGKHRIALVADTPRTLAERAALAAARLAEPRPGMLTTADGVFIGTAVAGRVTLLLPGQGAPVRADLGALGHELAGSPDHMRLDTGLGAAAGTAVAQPVIYRGTVAALRWLDRLGVTARAAVGHSLGEIAGLVWAGCLSAVDGDRLVRRRGRVMAALGCRGTTMASVAADAATAWALCAGTQLVVAAYNGPRSQVLAGSTADIQEAVHRATRQGISTVVLPVSHGFHSPAMIDCRAEFNACLREVPFQPPSGRLISTVSGRPLAPGDDIVDLLSDQLTAPVRFWDAIGELIPQTDLFCEVGPGHTLSALISAGCETPVVAIDAGAEDDRALAETTAALFAAGAVQDLDGAFADRPARPVDIWRDRVFLTNPCSSAPAIPPADSPAQQEKQVAEPSADDVSAVVLGLLAEASELDAALIDLDARLLGDLHLTSLRVTQLVVTAATTTGRTRPVAPLLLADATVAELIAAVTALPAADISTDSTPIEGLASWIG